MKPNFKLINFLAISSMIAGSIGMLFCFRFLWSNHMQDLVGAGFPFVAGAILFGTGLIALALNNQNR